MRTVVVTLAGLLTVAPLAGTASAADPAAPAIQAPGPDSTPAPHRHGKWRRHRAIGPLSFMLRHQADLGLTADQVKRLGDLRLDFRRDAIQRVADLRVVETELTELRRAEVADLPLIEAKLRDIERLRADLRLAAIRTIEAGKAELTADQRGKLRALFDEQRARRSKSPGSFGPAPHPAAPTGGA